MEGIQGTCAGATTSRGTLLLISLRYSDESGKVKISLFEHLNALWVERDKRIEQAQRTAEIAQRRADEALEKRLDLLNEFRAQNMDESAKYAAKEMVEARLDALAGRITAIESRSAGAGAAWGWVVAIATVAVGVIGLLLLLAKH